MISFALGNDQHHNGIRMVAHGYGLRADVNTITSDELLEKLNEVLTNNSYKENVYKASQIMKSRPMNAREETAYWIEHVLQFGSDHLRSHALEMPFYQYLMLDVLALVIILMFFFVALLYCLMKRACSSFRRKTSDIMLKKN